MDKKSLIVMQALSVQEKLLHTVAKMVAKDSASFAAKEQELMEHLSAIHGVIRQLAMKVEGM